MSIPISDRVYGSICQELAAGVRKKPHPGERG
jgi:hypothetical protein